MRSVNAAEMRSVEGGLAIACAIAGAVGITAGILITKIREHRMYGRCLTYPKQCWTCRNRW